MYSVHYHTHEWVSGRLMARTIMTPGFTICSSFGLLELVTETFKRININAISSLKGSQMSPLPVLVSLCFRVNIIVTCKILPFRWRSFGNKGYFELLFTFFSHKGKGTKIPSAHFYLHMYTFFAHTIDLFCLPDFTKIANVSGMDSLWCGSWYLDITSHALNKCSF